LIRAILGWAMAEAVDMGLVYHGVQMQSRCAGREGICFLKMPLEKQLQTNDAPVGFGSSLPRIAVMDRFGQVIIKVVKVRGNPPTERDTRTFVLII
jgi:hypothetical protein